MLPPSHVTMEELLTETQRGLGIECAQLAVGEGSRITALVPDDWISSLSEGGTLPSSCPKPDGLTATEVSTLLQKSVHRLPDGWSKVSIQVVVKSCLDYRISCIRCVKDCFSGFDGKCPPESFLHFMQGVCHDNFRNQWTKAFEKYAAPYRSATESKKPRAALTAIKHALQELYGFSCVPVTSESNYSVLSMKAAHMHTCPPQGISVLKAKALVETSDLLFVISSFLEHSLHSVVTFSPAKLANSHAKVLFVIYQVLQAMALCHSRGLTCGALSLHDLAIDERLRVQLNPRLSDYEKCKSGHRKNKAGETPESVTEEVVGHKESESMEEQRLCESCKKWLATAVTDWVHGKKSNFSYLMELNRLAGRRLGDPNYHPVLPWVVDFTVPFGKLRDMTKSKFRLNKGDGQLDFTYQMNKEAPVTMGGGHMEHLHVPHHITDVLSDITYYVYKARRTPREVLCRHVRSKWEPNEYPASMDRLQSWTPDECIPEFYTDPDIFRSIHADMPDLEIPAWCASYSDFIEKHRRLLESPKVSENLHHWVDLTFGYKLSGKEAIKAKNVCLHLVDNHTHLANFGVVQLFDFPHPQRMSRHGESIQDPPYITQSHSYAGHVVKDAVIIESHQIPDLDVPDVGIEGLDCKSDFFAATSSALPDEDDGSLEHAAEALDALEDAKRTDSRAATSSMATPSSSSSVSLLQLEPMLMGLMNTWKVKPQLSEGQELSSAKIILPEDFNPLQNLERLEAFYKFTSATGHCQLERTEVSQNASDIAFPDLLQRDMQALGVLIAEIFFAPKLRTLAVEATLVDRFKAVRKLCKSHKNALPLPLQHAVEVLLQLDKDIFVKDVGQGECSAGSLFNYPMIQSGLPPPSALQLISPHADIIPFPAYFPDLYGFVVHFYRVTESGDQSGLREFIVELSEDLPKLLGNLTSEGMEILLPFLLSLMSDKVVAVRAIQHLFESVAKALGQRNANRFLLKPLIGVYESDWSGQERRSMYEEAFVLNLIACLGLPQFLHSILSHIVHVVAGFESKVCAEDEDATAAAAAAGSPARQVLLNVAGTSVNHSESMDGAQRGHLEGGGDSEMEDFSGGVVLNDQVMLGETLDFTSAVFRGSGDEDGAQPPPADATSIGQDSNKSSGSDASYEVEKDGVSLKSVDSGHDLAGAERPDGGDVDRSLDEGGPGPGECTATSLAPGELGGVVSPVEVVGHTILPNLSASSPLVAGEAADGLEPGGPAPDSEDNDIKKLIRTACRTVRTLIGKLGPTLASRYVARSLLRLLSTCYLGPAKHQFVSEGGAKEGAGGGGGGGGRGAVYRARPVLGDGHAEPVVQCLVHLAFTYGEPVLTLQYIPHVAYAVASSLAGGARMSSRREASLLGAVAFTQRLVVYLSDTTLVDCMRRLSQEVLQPVVNIVTSPSLSFPSGGQCRAVLCQKAMNLMALLCLRIGGDSAQVHMADVIRTFFHGFSVAHSLVSPQGGPSESGLQPEQEDTGLEEIKKAFTSELAYAAFVPFVCLLGNVSVEKVIPNHELVTRLSLEHEELQRSQLESSPGSATDREPGGSFTQPRASSFQDSDEFGTFGGIMIGNRIQIPQGSAPSDVGPLGRVSAHSSPLASAVSTVSSVSSVSTVSTPTSRSLEEEESLVKQELRVSERMLAGNWLAYWQHDIGLNRTGGRFVFNQIKLQTYVGHTGTVKALCVRPDEDGFLSGGKDRTVRLWSLSNSGDGTERLHAKLTYGQHRRSVSQVAHMEGGQHVVSCDGSVHVWDCNTGSTVAVYEAPDSRLSVSSLAVLPVPHNTIVAATSDSMLRFIDTRKPGMQHEFQLSVGGGGGPVRCLAVSPHGLWVTAGLSSGMLVMLDVRTGFFLRMWQAHDGEVLQLKGVGSNTLVSSSSDHTLAVWKAMDARLSHLFRSTPEAAHTWDTLAGNGAGEAGEVIAGTTGNRIFVYPLGDAASGPATKLLPENFRGVLSRLAVLPSKRLLLLGSDNGSVSLMA
ncbi:WD repeat-containing protein 81 isoform X1 [Petromyzon marinus]|uniref:WD repeat-containing protein 81 isoform X1 n=1 Tax=Petromyzon marinus TaxID=7757 RepID=A0AAJ7SS31_PETMA|nr:WD repeat-containing protein 81 isoform X1 [Petromyzon marinus]